MANLSRLLVRRTLGCSSVKQSHWCQTATRKLHSGLLHLSEEVADALAAGRPVVALESTIITHGMPFPDNLRTAVEVERVIRDTGAVPATVAVLNGKLTVGLTERQLEELAAPSLAAVKTSRRDLAYVLSQGLSGGTTVSGTMVAAQRAGIPVFVTGGIGGVHRGAETTLDISADLRELGRTPVAVICAGVKSILDIGRTLEYLETEGVCVASYGPSRDFPAFFTPRSGLSAPYNVETARDAAKVIDTTLSLQLNSGLLIAVPIPEQDTVDGDIIEQAIQLAVEESRQKGIQGKEVTPYILKRVNELTSGRSLQANIALIKNNANVGGQIACEISLLRRQSSQVQGSTEDKGSFTSYPGHGSDSECKGSCVGSSKSTMKKPDKHGDIVVIGGTNVDISATVETKEILMNGATYPGRVRVSFGGVGRNVADALSRLGCTPLFVSAIGVDLYAKMFPTEHAYMNMRGVKTVDSHHSALYCALLKGSGELIYGLGDFDIHTQVTSAYVEKFENDLTRAPLVCIDGCIPTETIAYVCDVCSRNGVPVWFEPTDIQLAGKPFDSDAWRHLAYISPNLNELRVMHARIEGVDVIVGDASSVDGHVNDAIDESLVLVSSLLRHIPNIVVTLGKHGVLLCRRGVSASSPFPVRGHLPVGGDAKEYSFVHYPVGQITDVVSVSGAGDCLAATMMANIVAGQSADVCVARGLAAARLSLASVRAVPETLNPDTATGDDLPSPSPYPVPGHVFDKRRI